MVGADLGLYSITFTNNLDEEHQALREFQDFRLEAERKGFRYFLEVFNPNVEPGISESEIPAFVNDHSSAPWPASTKSGRPLFLKIAYNGPKALSELVQYDPQLIVGILGGSAGTAYDAFKMIADAQRYGARVALFGRKINLVRTPPYLHRDAAPHRRSRNQRGRSGEALPRPASRSRDQTVAGFDR